MRLMSESVIGEQVARALEKNVPRLPEERSRYTPAFFVDMSISKICHGLRSGEISYRMYCFAND